MKFGKFGQVGLVSAIALVVATLFTACGTLNVGFMFVATNQQTPGQIEVYEVDSESGSIRTIPTSPFPSGGRNPVAEAATPDSKNLYVVNRDDNNITQFGIGTDGKLYPQHTVNTPGSFPSAIAVNTAGTFLFVIDTLQPIAGCSPNNLCPGDIAVFPINTDGSLGTPIANNLQFPNYWPLQLTPTDAKTILTPTAVHVVASGNNVYVSTVGASTGSSYLFAYSVDATGALTLLNGSQPVATETNLVALASDSTSSYLYAADFTKNLVATYSLATGVPVLQSIAPSGNQPSSLTLNGDNFLYVANSLDSTVTGYGVSGGNLTNIATNASDADPVAIMVDPRHVGFLYTVNFLGSSLSGFQIDPNSGALINTQNTPYRSSVQPTAIAGIPHGGTTTAAAK